MMSELNKLCFDLSSEEIIARTQDVIVGSRKIIDSLVALEMNSWKDFIYPFSDHEADLIHENCNISALKDVSMSNDVRKSSEYSQKSFLDYFVEMKTRKDLFNKFVETKSRFQDEMEEVDRFYLDKVISDFERNGLSISEEKRQEVVETKMEITKNNIEFFSNVSEARSTTKLFFTKSELEGCSEQFLQGLEMNEEEEKYIITMKSPDLTHVYRYCSVENTRKIVFETRLSLCSDTNTKIMDNNIKLRVQLASLLEKYDNDYPTYRLDIRMIKTKENLLNFINSTKQKIDPILEKDFDVLLSLKRKETGDENVDFCAHDIQYYSRKRKEEECSIDNEKIREYFPYDIVVSRTLKIVGDLIGLGFEKIENASKREIWHEEVSYYQVRDSKSKEVISMFYLDSFPRPFKYPHFCVRPLQPTCIRHKTKKNENARQIPIAVMICNFSRSRLMTLSEVRTFCHELGHMIHCLCSEAKYARFSGYSVVFDFLEVPSMFLEKLAYREDFLEMISCHHVTKNSLDKETCQNIAMSWKLNRSIRINNILWRSRFDLMSYLTPNLDVKKLFNEIRSEAEKNVSFSMENTNGAASFSHLMSPTLKYDVGYYSYLYAEVISWDVFEVFFGGEKSVVECKEQGRRFREEILKWGGEKDEKMMLECFLGRKTEDKAFFGSF